MEKFGKHLKAYFKNLDFKLFNKITEILVNPERYYKFLKSLREFESFLQFQIIL